MIVDDPWYFRWISGATLVVVMVFIALLFTDRGGAWRKTGFGQSLMIMAFGLGLISLTQSLRQWFGDYAYRTTIRVIAQSLILIAMVIRTYLLARAQRRERRDRAK